MIWGIIGLGWLGQELASVVQKSGDTFWGTGRKDFDFNFDSFPNKYCDILFLNTPPLRNIRPSVFVDKINLSQSSKLIFISSTSVYGKNQGIIFERHQALPISENGHWLVEVESLLRKKFQNQLIVAF